MVSLLILAAIFSVLIVWYLPKLQVRKLEITARHKFEAENEARKTVAQILSAFFFFGTLYFTWQSYELSKQQSISAIYAKAIEQLAHNSQEVRLGAIYILENISRNSPDHYMQAIEVLAGYLRSRAPWDGSIISMHSEHLNMRCRPQTEEISSFINKEIVWNLCICAELSTEYLEFISATKSVDQDIQTALSVLGRRKVQYENHLYKLDLRSTDIRGMDLRKLNFERALFSGSNLSDANFRDAFLSEVDFSGAFAYGSLFGGAQLIRAQLHDMLATESNFYQANLSNATFHGSCLERVEMGEANLFRTDFGSSVLRDAKIWDANMRETQGDFLNLEGALLKGSDFSGADMVGFFNLTCEQLKEVKIEQARRQPMYIRCK